MRKQETLKGAEREKLLETLHEKYVEHPGSRKRWSFWRKSYSWLAAVKGARLIKRLFDLILSLFFLILLFPFLLAIALAIKFSDGGPIFYVSERAGKWGRPFRLPQFRVMVPGAEELRHDLLLYHRFKEESRFKMMDDPRMTPLGRFLIKSGCHELPLLWCVVKGQMSLVGPRPPPIEEAELYTAEERRRLDVLPGFTCLSRVEGKSDAPFSEQLKLDLLYIESQSLRLDVRLLFKTIIAILHGRGGY